MERSPEERLYYISKIAVGVCVLALAVTIGLGKDVVPPRFWFVVIVLGAGAIWWCAHQYQVFQSERAKHEAAERVTNGNAPKTMRDFEDDA